MATFDLVHALTVYGPAGVVFAGSVCCGGMRSNTFLAVTLGLCGAMTATSLGLTDLFAGKDLAIGAVLAVVVAVATSPIGRYRERRRLRSAGDDPGLAVA